MSTGGGGSGSKKRPWEAGPGQSDTCSVGRPASPKEMYGKGCAKGDNIAVVSSSPVVYPRIVMISSGGSRLLKKELNGRYMQAVVARNGLPTYEQEEGENHRQFSVDNIWELVVAGPDGDDIAMKSSHHANLLHFSQRMFWMVF